MSLLRGEGSSATNGEAPWVEDAQSTDRGSVSKEASRLPEDVVINAHRAQVAFLRGEIEEQPAREARGAGMGPEMLQLHEGALRTHLSRLATLGATELPSATSEIPEREIPIAI